MRALTEKPLGQPICQVPPAWIWLTGLLGLAFAATAVLGPYIEWHRTEGARGWLVPRTGVVRIASPAAGVVIDRFVDIGQRVDAGEVLAKVSTDFYDSDGGSRRKKNRQSIMAAMAESRVRETLLGQRYALNLDTANMQVRSLTAEQQSLERQLRVERKRSEIERGQLAKLAAAGNAISQWDLLVQEKALAERQSTVEGLQQRSVRVERELKTLKSKIDSMAVEAELALSDLLIKRTELQRELDNGASEIALVAPVAGHVADVSLAVGDAVARGAHLISVLPAGAELSAELRVPSKSAALLESGQEVRLFIDAWPREKFGAVNGIIDRVAAFVGDSDDGSTNGTYRVIVTIEPTDRPLRPGMSLGAELLLERRDLIDWIIGPLRSRFGE